jgi:hypothetical protein
MIGEGYFGKVYRAELRSGHVLAVKRAKKVLYLIMTSLVGHFMSSEGSIGISPFVELISHSFM